MSDIHMTSEPQSGVDCIPGSDVPVYRENNLPEEAYFPMAIVDRDPSCPNDLLALTHLPIDRLLGNSAAQLVSYSVAGNGAVFEVPDRQVIPGYISQSTTKVEQASADLIATLAKFLIIEGVDGNYVVQNTGLYRFPTTHNYVVGRTYYLSDTDGLVTTVPGTNNQALFYVLDSTTIAINVGL